jgi:hypothetical protein
MEEIKNILNEIVKDYGLKILEDPQKFKAVFADYAKGEYIAEKDLFTKIIEAGCAKEIINADDISTTKKTLVKKIHDKYFLDEKILDDYLDIFISFLRSDYTVESQTRKKATVNKTAAKKPAAKKPTVKTVDKKPAVMKTPAKKPAVKKTVDKRPAAMKTPAMKPATKNPAFGIFLASTVFTVLIFIIAQGDDRFVFLEFLGFCGIGVSFLIASIRAILLWRKEKKR